MKKTTFLILALLGLALCNAKAAVVSIKMNAVSCTMSLADKATNTAVDLGSPSGSKSSGYLYTVDVAAGTYLLTAYGTDDATINGTVELNITDENEQSFSVFTVTTYATNSGWSLGEDYSVAFAVATREGKVVKSGLGASVTANRATFLVLNGCSYNLSLIPSDANAEKGYLAYESSGTVTANVTASGAIPMGAQYSVTIPADAKFFLGKKTSHFVPFTEIEPKSVSTDGANGTIYTYMLANNQVYNYRTWKEGGITNAGKFTMNISDPTKVPTLNFTNEDYNAKSPTFIDRDPASNSGYNVGNIYLNINERNHLRLHSGESKDLLAIRDWQLTDNITNNYFIDPDYHYTIIPLEGNPVVIDNANTDINPWSVLHANSKGTAIVLVSYDAISVSNYSGATKGAIAGGEYWSAIWPENTGVFIVSVDDNESTVVPNIVINEGINSTNEKTAGDNVDADFDVFYYLEGTEGYSYNFTPTNAAKVEIAYPTILENAVNYDNGFQTVEANADGSYTLLLKHGRQIVRLTDSEGASVYQVLTAKKCNYTIENISRPGATTVQPGEQIKVQYSGLYHPANKLAGIHNFTAKIVYSDCSDGKILSSSGSQYTFGGTPSAQAVTFTLPVDWDTAANSIYSLSGGKINVSGFGDPIGNHRIINKAVGRNPNFNAIGHNTYFGTLPDISINVVDVAITAHITADAEDATIVISDCNGKIIEPNPDNSYTLRYGVYSYTANAEGYKQTRGTFVNEEGVVGSDVDIHITMQPIPANGWDGKTLSEPQQENDTYQISNGAELAWFANEVTGSKRYTINGALACDIDLCGFDWTPIGGTASSTAFKGTFDGRNHTVFGLYINSKAAYQALFGYVDEADIANLTAEGAVITTGNYAAGLIAYAKASNIANCVSRVAVSGKQYCGGVTGYANGASTLDRCGSEADVMASSSYAGGITSYAGNAQVGITNCYNTATVSGTGYTAGIAGRSNVGTTIKNCLNVGSINCSGSTSGGIFAGSGTFGNIADNYVLRHYANGIDNETIATLTELANGSIAQKLGEAWGQAVGIDPYPLPGRPLTLVLTDKSELTLTEPLEVSRASYTRDDLDGKGWYSCVLPYDFELPAGVTAISNATIEGNTVIFTDLNGTIAANTPFLYKTEAKEVVFAADNAAVAATDSPASGALRGTYARIEAGKATGKLILNSAGEAFATATETASIPPFRAFIDAPAAGANSYIIVLDDLTSIDSADATGAFGLKPADIYDIDGKLVRKNATLPDALDQLKDGIYIINNKKIKK